MWNLEQLDFKTKLVKEEDKEYYILVKWSTSQDSTVT